MSCPEVTAHASFFIVVWVYPPKHQSVTVVLFTTVFEAYKKLSGSDIEDSVTGETTGNLENLLVAVGKISDLSGSYFTDYKVVKIGR